MKLEIRAPGKAAIVLYGVLSALASGAIVPLLPFIDKEFGTPENGVMVKMVLTALGIGTLVGAPLGGYLADRLGLRIVMLWSAIGCGIAGCAVFLSTSLIEVLAARFLIGAMLGAFGSAMVAAIGQAWDGNERDRWLGLVMAIGTLSLLIVSPLTGVLADMGWRNAFILYGLAFPLAIAVVMGFSRGGGAAAQSQAEQAASGGLPIFELCALGVVAGSVSAGSAMYTPFLFQDLGVTTATGIAIFSLSSAIMVGVAGIAYGFVRRKLSLTQIFVIGPVLCCVGLALAAVSGSPVIAALCLAVQGIGIGLVLPSLNVHAIQKSQQSNRARAVGIVRAAMMTGPFLVQFALEPLSRMGGPGLALLALAACSALFAIVAGLLRVGTIIPAAPRPEAAE